MDRPPVFAFLLVSATPQTQAARAIADLSLAVGGVALCAASHRFPALLKAKRPLALVGGLLASASSLVTALVAHAHLIAPQALITMSVAFSVGHLLLIASWFLASRALPSRRLLPAALVAFALSMVLVVIDFLPATCHLAVVIALPLACAVLACFTRDDDLTLGLLEPYERPSFKPATFIDVMAIGLLFAEMAAATLIRSLWAHQGIGYTASQTAIATYLFSLVIALVCALTCARSAYAEKGAFGVSIITLPILVAASFGFLFLDGNALAVSIVTSVSSVAAASLMAMTSLAFRGKGLPYLAGAGVYAAALGTTTWLAYSALPSALHFTGSAPSQLAAPVVFAAVCAIMTALACAFGAMLFENSRRFEEWQHQTTATTIVIKAGRGASAEVTDEAEPMRAATHDDDATPQRPDPPAALRDRLREAFALTSREADIAELLAQGYTAKRVAEELTLSVSTVQSYTKTIYRKMDVHKKDELIEKIGVLR